MGGRIDHAQNGNGRFDSLRTTGPVYERGCFGCEAGQARSLVSVRKELADLRANTRARFFCEARFLLRLRSKVSVFHSYPVLFSNLEPQFGYHALDFTFMEDTNAFEKGCLFHNSPNVGCFLVSRGASRRDSHGHWRLCSDTCGRHAPTTATVATVAARCGSSSGRRDASTTGTMALSRFSGQLEASSKRKGRLLKPSLSCYDLLPRSI